MRAKLRSVVVLGAVLALAGGSAYAQCPIDGATPFQAGPLNPKSGFPLWVQDTNGLSLEICLDPVNCFFDPVDPSNPYSVRVGFGPEAFWWLADGSISARNIKAGVVMAAEAAWLNENPTPGDQFPFTRLRFRLDGLVFRGKYRVTHPYGITEFVVDTLDAKGKPVGVFVSHDMPFAAAGQNQGRVGPFLKWDPAVAPFAPAGYIGDGVTPHRVKGSPCGTDFLKVEGWDLTGKRLDLDGRGNNFVTTDLFTVSGKVATRAGVGVTRAAYTRGPWDPGVEVFAFSRPGQLIRVNVPNNPVALMAGDANGRYYGFVEGDVPQSNVTFTNISDPPELSPAYPESSVTVPLTDTVFIKEAYYYRNTTTLDVMAASSDEVSLCPAGVPRLTAYTDSGTKLGDLTIPVTGGIDLTIPTLVPPPSVTVKSCFGGSATAIVDIGKCARAGSSLTCKQ